MTEASSFIGDPAADQARTLAQRRTMFEQAKRDRQAMLGLSPAERLSFKARGNQKLARLGFDRQTRTMRSQILKAKR